MKKALVLLSLALILVLTSSLTATANTAVYVDGQAVNYPEATPIQQGGILMVPVRATFGAMGAEIGWNAVNSSTTITLADHTVSLRVGSRQATADGQTVTLPQAPFIQNGRTLVPFTAVAEALGCTVTDDNAVNSYIIKAEAVLNSLASGDPAAITNYVSANGYIQHNLTFADGRQTMLDALPLLVEAGSTVEIQRAFVDGEYVFLHTRYALFSVPQAGFDIFRFENGLIVEHWDNLDAIAAPNPSGHSQFDGATTLNDLDKTAENKQLVAGFVGDVLRGENPDALASYFDGDNYIQYNSGIADGLSGLGEALAAMAEAGIEMVYDETYMVLGQGNFVLTVSEGSFGGVHSSFYDLFRVENGKIIEHWDVIESILPEAEHAHSNGKF